MTKKDLLKELEKYDDDCIICCDSYDGTEQTGGYICSVTYNEADKLIEINFV